MLGKLLKIVLTERALVKDTRESETTNMKYNSNHLENDEKNQIIPKTRFSQTLLLR